MDKPVFIISLDTEMLWGPAGGKEGLDLCKFMKKNEQQMRDTITTLLNLFKKHKISATWAIVGHLFLDHCDEDTCLTKVNMSKFGFKKLWYKDPYSNIEKDPLYYGKDIIEKILSNPIKHELGYHSFSHVCFPYISREMAEGEIKESKKIEKEWNIKFSSFIFPINEIAYVDILIENGFKIYRGKDITTINNKQNLFFNKIHSGIIKFIAPPVQPRWNNGIWEIQTSMMFCDTQIPQSLILRGKLGLDRTIKEKKIFHIWLHPWNLIYFHRLKDDLEKMLKYISKRRDEGKIEIMTMNDLAEYLNSNYKM
jgi:peptidoglycan/xylan/chitin deacetylase (PgdA/CDA1 family)